jgi:hypothetical protein
MHCLRHLLAYTLRASARRNFELAGIEPLDDQWPPGDALGSLLGNEPRYLLLNGVADPKPVTGGKAMQYELFNMHFDILALRTGLMDGVSLGLIGPVCHTHPAISVSVSGFSSLANSLRAAASR